MIVSQRHECDQIITKIYEIPSSQRAESEIKRKVVRERSYRGHLDESWVNNLMNF